MTHRAAVLYLLATAVLWSTGGLLIKILGNLLTGLIGLPFIIHAPFTAPSVGAILFLGVFQLGFSYLFFTRAIRHVTALEGILIPVLEPLLNPLWVFLLMGERPGGWAILGGLTILTAVTGRYVLKKTV